jgi:hypothetical protein
MSDYEDSGDQIASELGDIRSSLGEIHSVAEEIDSSLGRINSSVQEVRASVRGNSGAGEWIGIVIVVWLIGIWPGSKLDKWTAKIWNSINHDADMKNVMALNRPSNCDFFHAPIGSKGCSYEKRVDVFGEKERQLAVQNATNPEDVAHYRNEPNSVTVFWDKKED